MRQVTTRYEDPLERIWLTAAERIGLKVERTEEAFATTDGRGVLRLGNALSLDADDSLAQMIFHELCHSLVQGPESFEIPDWGLDNYGEADLEREHACLRLQAWLGARYGLRTLFAPTTDHRAYYDALPDDPFDGSEPCVHWARLGASRVERDPWAPHLESALEATMQLAYTVARFEESRPPNGAGPSLWRSWVEPPSRHPTGGFVHPAAQGRACAGCAWSRSDRDSLRCAARGATSVQPEWPACERFQPSLSCESCGACCREAYQVVELDPSDPFVRKHPDLVTRQGARLTLARVDGRCPPLRGDGRGGPFRCALYADRPISCREFEQGSENCFDARRRVGLSP